MRHQIRAWSVSVAAVVLALSALPGPALAYISGANNGTGVLPGTGTCTINGATTAVTSLQLSLTGTNAQAEVAADGSMVYRSTLVAYCGTRPDGSYEYVMGSVVVPLAYAINDTGGTLTINGVTVPQTFTGGSFDGYTGTVNLTSGYGPVGPVVYGADTAAEKKTVVSLHRQITAAKTNADRVRLLNQLQSSLE